MKTQEYIQSLFSDYEETGNLKDFMEELQSNLDARIANLVRKGFAENDAFDKACAELGDISVLAKELSLKKRREVFEEKYMDIRKYMSAGRVAAYVIFGFLALFGIVIALVGYFASGLSFGAGPAFANELSFPAFDRETGNLVFFASLLPFIVTSVGGLVFLGLTQETGAHYPMNRKRAAWYTAAASLIVFGLLVMVITYFSVRFADQSLEIMTAIAVLIPFVLPGSGLLTFLVLTEKSRLKPWMASVHEDAAKRNMKIWNDPATAGRFGMFSGAIWLFAAAFFFLFGFLAGFRYSWIIFVFAVAIQMFVQGLMMKKE